MTRTYFPFGSGSGSNVYESQWTKMAKLWRETGIIPDQGGEFQVSDPNDGLNVSIASGVAWVMGHYFEDDSTTTLAMTGSAVGHYRMNIVYIEVNWGTDVCTIGSVYTANDDESESTITLVQTEGVKWQFPLATVKCEGSAVTLVTNTGAFSRISTSSDVVYLQVYDKDTSPESGTSKMFWTVPEKYNGKELLSADIACYTVPSTTTLSATVYNATDSVDMLTTAPIIATSKYNTYETGCTRSTVNASYKTVATGDRLRIDIVGTPDTACKGLDVILVIGEN